MELNLSRYIGLGTPLHVCKQNASVNVSGWSVLYLQEGHADTNEKNQTGTRVQKTHQRQGSRYQTKSLKDEVRSGRAFELILLLYNHLALGHHANFITNQGCNATK